MTRRGFNMAKLKIGIYDEIEKQVKIERNLSQFQKYWHFVVKFVFLTLQNRFCGVSEVVSDILRTFDSDWLQSRPLCGT